MKESMKKDLKIIVIGSSGTGKTSFVQRWLKDEYQDNYKPTILSEFGYKIFKYEEILFRVQLWDIGGQDKSPAVTKIFAKDSHGCLILTDINNKKTLDEALIWKQLVEEESLFTDGDKIPFLLIQNKIDLINNEDNIKKIEKETKEFCEKNKFVNYFLASAKSNKNINESMDFFLEHIIKRLLTYLKEGNEDVNSSEYRKTMRLSSKSSFDKVNKDSKKKCC